MRCAVGMLAMCTLLILGCPEKKPAPVQTTDSSPAMEPDLYSTSTGGYATPAGAPSAYPASSNYAAAPAGGVTEYGAPSTGAASAPMGSASFGGGQSHVVAKGDTLYKLARQYYSDQSRWKDIYEANRNVIPNPNMLKVGQQLVIP